MYRMSSLVQLVLDYCKGDYLKCEKELEKLRCKAIALETDSESEDSDYEPDSDYEDVDSEYEDEVEEERITIIKYKSGHTRIL
jgi:hypothetical protein